VDRIRSQLDLQVNLIVDQRCAKIIELIEELRRDSPNLHDRHDQAAEMLKSAIDPEEIVTAIETRIGELIGGEVETSDD
jgi:uncharacterized membrane protein